MEPIDLAHEDWQLATHNYQQGDMASAEKICREILAELPAHVGAMHLLGVICGRTGRLQEAVQTLQRASQLEPSSSEIMTHMSYALAQSGALGRALTGFIRVREINPASVDAIAMIGNLSLQLGRYSEAAEALSEAADLRPRAAEMQMLKGHAMLRIGRMGDAEMSLRRALELKPELAEAAGHLAECLTAQSRYDESEALCLEYVQRDPRITAQLIRLYLASNRRDEAIAAARQSVDSLAPTGEAVRLIAQEDTKSGDLIGAIELIQSSLPRLAQDPIDMAGAMFELARLQLATGDATAAMTTAIQARSALAPQGRPKFMRGKHYLRMIERLALWPTPDELSQWQADANAPACAAVVGIMGARSDILTQALRTCTTLKLTDGRSTLIGLGGELPGQRLGSEVYPAMISALDDSAREEVRRSYLNQLRDDTGALQIDAHEHNIEHLAALARVNPNLSAVVVVRDPFDALAEAMIEPTVTDDSALVLTSVADMAAGILGQFRIITQTSNVPGLRVLIVDADKLATDADRELSRIIEFLSETTADPKALVSAAAHIREAQRNRLPAGVGDKYATEFAPIRSLLKDLDVAQLSGSR